MRQILVAMVFVVTASAAVAGAQQAAGDSVAAQAGSGTVTIGGTSMPLSDLTRADVARLTYDDLIALPFEDLVAIADKLEISVDELLSMKMTVASGAATTIREQPGILSVITRDDIRRSGARDLTDVLRMVPGFWFGMDVEGVSGILIRGNWAHEGKVLVLIDGLQMNENRYSAMPMEQHLSVDNIERIEVIRGPGSSMYGGYAELGVINITTRQAADLNGVAASRSIGAMGKSTDAGLDPTWSRNNTWFAVGIDKEKVGFSLGAYHNNGHRTDEVVKILEPLTDDSGVVILGPDGKPLTISENFAGDVGLIASTNVNAAVRLADLNARFVFDHYQLGAVSEDPYSNTFTTLLGQVRYDAKLAAGKLTLSPAYNFQYYDPWHTEGWYENITTIRNSLGIGLAWNPLENFSVSAGIEAHYDNVEQSPDYDTVENPRFDPITGDTLLFDDDTLLYNGTRSAAFVSGAAYAQGLLRIPQINLSITGGIRYEYHEKYYGAIAPRVALTQVLGPVHYKLLYNRGYHSPSIGNIEYNQDIRPEKTDVFEIELGAKVTKHIFMTANVFDIILREPISYWAEGDLDGYFNGGRLGSVGFETEVAVRYPRLSANASYSFYSAGEKPQEAADRQFVGSEEDRAYFGAPQHKVALSVTARAWKDLYVTPSFVFASEAYANTALALADTVWEPKTSTVSPRYLLNLFVSYEDFIARGLTVGLGVYDIFDQDAPWVQAYWGTESPYPSSGREVVARITYAFSKRR